MRYTEFYNFFESDINSDQILDSRFWSTVIRVRFDQVDITANIVIIFCWLLMMTTYVYPIITEFQKSSSRGYEIDVLF